ncbi:hypothetical protein, partial [Pseudomonas sp. UBA6276]|uniref:hypothetical protein n=1 Tax=Pseudomonas sp. UBA6276 TaxID=1947324 RepID=UPI0025799D01
QSRLPNKIRSAGRYERAIRKGRPFLCSRIGKLPEAFHQGFELSAAHFNLGEQVAKLRVCFWSSQAAPDIGQGASVRLLMLVKAHQVQRQ